VVGVVGDARFSTLRNPAEPTAYVSFRQHDQHVATFALRTAVRPGDLIPEVERAAVRAAPDVPPYNIRTQDAQIDTAVKQERLFAGIVSGFAAVAALLACLGIYGTLSYAVTRRTGEIGVRVALGASRWRVVWLVLRESVLPVLLGLVMGLVAAAAASRVLESMLFGLTPHDASTYVASSALLLASALAAAWLPAFRAARMDPMTTLRCE